ncbi:18930_t:CDS:2, partial [Racocetra persica]
DNSPMLKKLINELTTASTQQISSKKYYHFEDASNALVDDKIREHILDQDKIIKHILDQDKITE